MKKYVLFGVVGVLVCALSMNILARREPALTAEQIVAKCAEAMGGADKIAALKTLRTTQIFPDHSGLIRYEIKRPNLVRMGTSLVFDGKRAGWLERKAADGTVKKPELVPQEEWKDFEMDIAWYFPAFFDHPSEYLGKETVNGIESYKLRVKLPLGTVVTYFLDVHTDLILKASADFTIRGKEYYVEHNYSDYREQDGILYPHAFTYSDRSGKGVLTATMKKLEFNIPLDDSHFALPEGIK